MNKKVVIIGAGLGCFTAGMLLANNGFEVEIFELSYCEHTCLVS